MFTSTSLVVLLLTGPVIHCKSDEMDSSDDDTLLAWSHLLRGSTSSAADGFIGDMERPGVSTRPPDSGMSGWSPMSAAEFYASRASDHSIRHSTHTPFVSSLPDAQCPTNSGSSEDDGSDVDGDVHSSAPLPPDARPSDFLPRGTVLFFTLFFWLVHFICFMLLAAI